MARTTPHVLTPSALLCLLLGTGLPAQIGPSDTVIANTRGSASSRGIKLVSQNMRTCKAIRTLKFNTETSFPLSGRVSGGAAYDAVRGGVWYTNGSFLSCVDPVSGKVICKNVRMPVVPRLKLSPFSFTAAGLAFDNRSNTLYIADAVNGDLYQVRLGTANDPRACLFTSRFVSVRPHMPASHWLGGLAIDQVNGMLFVGSHHMTKGTRHIYVTTLAKWGGKTRDVTGKGNVHPGLCPTGRASALWIQGLAFDSGRRILHVGDGTTTSAYSYDPTNSRIASLGCCKNPSAATTDSYVGLALMPTRSTRAGRPCSARPCSNCPNMALGALGDAAVGNPHFALSLTGAPTNSSSALAAIGFGRCTSPGIRVGFCGPLLIATNTPVLVVGVALTRGGGTCGSSAELSIPIPSNAGLIGTDISSQFLLSCRTVVAIGHALSNCVNVQVTR